MKSIKEKAEEHLNSVYYGYDNVLKTLVKEGYEAGANYVLGEVEKMLSKVNKYKDGSDHTVLYLDIEYLIEQLKK